ncbi:1-aminocyclopropane-1-carboxylate oxidase 1-like protein [Corchorus olitorius]|uniref:1-aminocyclopropane-1-carboxylate oxidase 1-like protein n=1 Tax=Corchorus olitorius TaxID=93759 RepID=A0A1R3JKY4_9ROSI|nr:1-aminocyclopropane-1-carboxylate oxidase 1-like protein [Corchorus olitorius]
MAAETLMNYDRAKELKDFDDTKAGVKGLIDSGIVNTPKMFIRPAEELAEEQINPCQKNTEVPTIDLSNIQESSRQTADWRDSLNLSVQDSDPDPSEMPAVCRKPAIEYSQYIKNLGETLFELLSEPLGLEPYHLGSMGCTKGFSTVCHYYPACPQPELTLGVKKHADPGLLTLLLQNEISGLQILHEGQWFDVQPIRGGLVVNIGDLLQMISNDKFKSVKHRVLATPIGPRISVGCFFSGHASLLDQPFGPIKELTSEANPPRYKEAVLKEYIAKFVFGALDKKPPIDHYKI